MDIENKTLAQLQEIAKSLGIKSYSKYKKADLAVLILEMAAETEVKDEPEHDETEKTPDSEKQEVSGVLEVLQDGYGFLRGPNYLSTNMDVYVSINQIKRFRLKTGDKIAGIARNPKGAGEKSRQLIYVSSVNGDEPYKAARRCPFEYLVPVYPDKRIKLETSTTDYAMRLIDLIAPLGRGQRGLIVAPPKAGKTTLLKNIAHSVSENAPDAELIVLLIDERPEEVTDMQKCIRGDVIYSTFDEQPEHHIKVAEMVLERAQRIAEQKKDVVILLDSLTRLARSYNIVNPSSGKTLSGGLDPNSLYKPKKFFGAARNIENGGSITILATALVETGSRMDDVIFEEFKGTGNMEVHLDRKLQERRIFPAIDVTKSGTRKEELLVDKDQLDAMYILRRKFSGSNSQDFTERLISLVVSTKSNKELIEKLKKL